MSGRHSAGVLLYRRRAGEIEVFLVHLGGPFWARKDTWFMPKGGVDPGEAPLAAARREFQEETGFSLEGPFQPLGEVRTRRGKRIEAWAAEGECDPAALRSATVEVEWPPRSRRLVEVPEVDRGGWFTPADARRRMTEAEWPLVERLLEILGAGR